MTNINTTDRGFRYGNPAHDCAHAQMSALCRQLATVVSIDGEITDLNLASVTSYATRYVLCEKPFVLDLSDVDECTDGVVDLLYAIDDASFDAEVEWAVVASPAVQAAMRHFGEPADFHTVDSVPDALHHFADETAKRRRLLPILTKTA